MDPDQHGAGAGRPVQVDVPRGGDSTFEPVVVRVTGNAVSTARPAGVVAFGSCSTTGEIAAHFDHARRRAVEGAAHCAERDRADRARSAGGGLVRGPIFGCP
jgi:hypothetical protein